MTLRMLIYNFVFSLLLLLLIPLDLMRGWRKGRPRKGIAERLGVLKKTVESKASRVFWIHAVSVGETRAALTLGQSLRQQHPDARIVLTCFTETGYGLATDSTIPHEVLFAPVDLSWVVSRFIRYIQPDLLIIMETEIWPALIATNFRHGIPVILANGRISEKSYPRYLKFRALFRPILEKVTFFYMQSELDAERIITMGAPQECVDAMGNLKFDQIGQGDVASSDEIRRTYGLPDDIPIWVAGSTHDGEEEQILSIYAHLLKVDLKCHLVLVPRHPERARTVTQLCSKRGLSYRLRSDLAHRNAEPAANVLLVDTIGDLEQLYAASDIVFIGGSLVPHGGHNILEPLRYGKPVLWGPHMHNFKDITKLVLAGRGGMQVANANELQDVLRHFLGSPQQFVELGKNGRLLLEHNRGASSSLASSINRLCPSP